jgi:hypothetical protein
MSRNMSKRRARMVLITVVLGFLAAVVIADRMGLTNHG